MNILEAEQYILTNIIDKIADFQKEYDKVGNPYSNIIRIMSTEPQLVFNKILACEPDVYNFFNDLTPLQKGYMVPKIEIYKKGKEGEDIPLTFRSHFDTEEFLKWNAVGRQDGVGLKKISITDKNENQSDAQIEVKIDLFFDNVLALANSSFKELITVPKIRKSNTERDYRIKLVIGWETPLDASGQVFSAAQLDVIERSNVVYQLNLTTHDISFKENGNIEISVNYQGSIARAFATNPDYDIFALTTKDKVQWFESNVNPLPITYKEAIIDREAIEKELEEIDQQNATSGIANDKNMSEATKNKIKEKEAKKTEWDKIIEVFELQVLASKYSAILTAIHNNNRMCYIEVPPEFAKALTDTNQIKSEGASALLSIFPSAVITGPIAINGGSLKYIREDAFKTLIELLDKASSSADPHAAIASAPQTAGNVNSTNFQPASTVRNRTSFGEIAAGRSVAARHSNETSEKYRINYITLGDIVNILLTFLPTATEADVILGPCKINNLIINLAQFPISLRTFITWFNDQVVRTVRPSYFLWEFIKDITNDLIKSNLMGLTLKGAPATYANIMVSSIVSDKKLDKGNIYADTVVVSGLSRNIHNTSKLYSYFILYIYDYNIDHRFGNLEEDMKNGIYHFTIGRNAGVLKDATFSKIDFPELRAMRLVDGKLQKPGDLLKEHYSMNMTTIGCPIFVNGQVLYFDASYLGLAGRKASEDLGLGGYYLVTGIETTISTENYEQSVKAVWNSIRSQSEEEIITMVMSEIENAKQLGLQSLKALPDPSITRDSNTSFFGKF